MKFSDLIRRFGVRITAEEIAAERARVEREFKEPDKLARIRAALDPFPGSFEQLIVVPALAAQKDPVKLGPVIGALSMISRYVQLQPNAAGLGININNMIDDIVERAEKKARGDLP